MTNASAHAPAHKPCHHSHTQAKLGRRTTLTILNPKAISVSELYGVLDKDTRDWTDGLLSSLFRRARNLPPRALGGRALPGHTRVCAGSAATTARAPPPPPTPGGHIYKHREQNKPLPPDRDEARYLVFDGDVDPVRPAREGGLQG